MSWTAAFLCYFLIHLTALSCLAGDKGMDRTASSTGYETSHVQPQPLRYRKGSHRGSLLHQVEPTHPADLETETDAIKSTIGTTLKRERLKPQQNTSVPASDARAFGNSQRKKNASKDEGPEKTELLEEYGIPVDSGDLKMCSVRDGMDSFLDSLDVGDSSHDDDFFNCSRCVCQDLKHKASVAANCVGKGLNSIPIHLPSKTMNLNVSHNSIPKLNLSRLLGYQELRTLIVRESKILAISHITRNSRERVASVRILDLSFNSIKTCHGGVFAIFPNLQRLSLRGNLIKYVTNDSFMGLPELNVLDLSFNSIHTIDCLSFDGFKHLSILYLSMNKQLGYREDNLSPTLFKNLKHLKSLHIQGSSNGSTAYPNHVVGELINLQDLNIDALSHPAEFGPEFKRLKFLKTLRFGPYADCHLENMSTNFFQYFRHLRCLYYVSCDMTGFNPQAYNRLQTLEALIMKDIQSSTLDNAFIHLSGFHERASLKHLSFVNLTKWQWPCIWMDGRQGRYMRHLNLTTIDLSHNRLSLLTNGFLRDMSKTLERLILRDNKFTLINPFWTTLINFTKLIYLDVSFQNMENHYYNFHLHNISTRPNINYIIQTANTHPIRDSHKRDVSESMARIGMTHDSSVFGRGGGDSRDQDLVQIDRWPIVEIPVNLKTVKASWYNFYGGLLLNSNIGKNSLETLDFSSSSLRQWGKGKIPSGVKKLNLGDNSCEYISADFFQPNNTLQALHLGSNNLGSFLGRSNGDLMKNLKILDYLDLSTNNIYSLPFDFFKGLVKIKNVKLAQNRMEVLNISFASTKDLVFLDLYKNSISLITENTRRDLDKLATKKSGMVLDLRYNSLMCTCDRIEMLHWMATTRVHFLNIKLYTCLDNENNYRNINSRHKMMQEVKYLKTHCAKNESYLLIVGLTVGSVFLAVFAVCVVYRYRWWIRYKKQVLLAKWFGFKPYYYCETNYSSLYKYEAFLLYTEEDRPFAITCSNELEKKRSHKLFIGDRDILPGTDEMAAIVSAVQNSRRTLVIITDNFIKDLETSFRESPMLHYTLQMAIMEEYCTHRRTLHLMLCTDHENVKYPHYLLRVFSEDCVTQFPPIRDGDAESAMTKAMWKKLSGTIGHIRRICDDDNDRNFCFHDYSQDNTYEVSQDNQSDGDSDDNEAHDDSDDNKAHDFSHDNQTDDISLLINADDV